MNIERYKWPVIVAAGLHGALFLGTPDSSRVHVKTLGDTPRVLPAKPLEEFDEIPLADDDSSADESSAAGNVAVPTLPDLPAPLIDKTDFVISTTIDHPSPENPVRTLEHYVGGAEGPSIGSLSSNRRSFVDGPKLDKNPRATAQLAPDYPASMRSDGIGGSVTVDFAVNKEGRVVSAEAVNYSRREFVEPALRAVRNWRFEPGRQNGRVVAFRMTVPIEFSLDHK